MSRCWFVDDHCHLYEVKWLGRLVELNRSTYHARLNPTLSDRYLDDAWFRQIGGVATSVLAAPLHTGRSAASLQLAGV